MLTAYTEVKHDKASIQPGSQPHGHLVHRHLVQSKSTVPVIVELFHSVCDARAVSLIQNRVVDSCSSDAANDGGQQRDKKVKLVRREHLMAVDDGREETGAKVSCGVNSLVLSVLFYQSKEGTGNIRIRSANPAKPQ